MVRSLIVRLFNKTFRKKVKQVAEAETWAKTPESSEEEIDDVIQVEDESPNMDILHLSRTAPLHADQIEGAHTTTVQGDKGEVVAKQTVVKYSANQAYCFLSDVSPVIAGKAVKLAEVEGQRNHLKLVSIEKERENRRLLPIFVQFHTLPEARTVEAHLTDRLAVETLGRWNLELKKNVTIDSFAYTDSWRDEAGFIVTDRNRYEYATFDAKQFVSTLRPSSDVQISAFSSDDLDAVCDFDAAVTGLQRDKVLEFMASNATMFVAKGTSGVDGFLVGKGDHVCALYAETMEIAHALLAHYVKAKKLIQIQLFTRLGVWECQPSSRRSVYRMHTRAVPSSIKWPKVYAVNMGFHIV